MCVCVYCGRDWGGGGGGRRGELSTVDSLFVWGPLGVQYLLYPSNVLSISYFLAFDHVPNDTIYCKWLAVSTSLWLLQLTCTYISKCGAE